MKNRKLIIIKDLENREVLGGFYGEVFGTLGGKSVQVGRLSVKRLAGTGVGIHVHCEFKVDGGG